MKGTQVLNLIFFFSFHFHIWILILTERKLENHRFLAGYILASQDELNQENYGELETHI